METFKMTYDALILYCKLDWWNFCNIYENTISIFTFLIYSTLINIIYVYVIKYNELLIY